MQLAALLSQIASEYTEQLYVAVNNTALKDS